LAGILPNGSSPGFILLPLVNPDVNHLIAVFGHSLLLPEICRFCKAGWINDFQMDQAVE